MTTRLPACCLILFSFAVVTSQPVAVSAVEPLAPRIDQLVEAGQIGPVAPLSSDSDFLRRVTLDLTGDLPSSVEARAFLDDATPNKRELLVDRLLASPRYSIHMANVFDVMLMERRPATHVTVIEWQKYLQEAFVANKPYDQLAREILSSDGVDPALRPAAKFVMDRAAEPNLLARDTSRVFFGMDLQCAQCHDHPLVDHYLQTDYHGMYAFFQRTTLFADATQKKSFLAETSHGDASYKSVFTGDAGQTRPRLPGENELDEPRFRQGEDYTIAPAANVRSVPKYSRRAKLAELATNGTNRQFNVNITNRLWAQFMGRGLVHPVDLIHPDNPPSHPAVLDLITNELVAMKYDMRWLVRELVLTKTYQRSIDLPADPAPQLAAAVQQTPVVEAEHVRLKGIADVSRKASDAAREEWKTARKTLEPAEAAWKAAEAEVAKIKKPVDDALIALAKTNAGTTAKQTAITAVNEAAAKTTEAAKLLPADKELAGAVVTFTAKQTQLATELAALQKQATDQTAAHAAAVVKLTEGYPPADAAYAALVEAAKPIDAVRAKFLVAWNQHKADAALTGAQRKKLEQLQAHVALNTALANAAAAQAAIEPTKAELAAAMLAVEQQQVEVTKQTTAVAEMDKVMVEATKQLDEAKATYTAKQGVVQSVVEAIAKTDAVLAKLPGDAEITLVVAKLKEKHEPLVKEATTLEQVMAAKDATAKDVAGKLAALKQSLSAAATEMATRQQTVTSKTNAVNQALAAVPTTQAAVATGRVQLTELWTNAAGVRVLKQLNPEQLAWATLQSTGVVEPQRLGAEAETEKTIPKASVAADPVLAKTREFKVAAQIHEIHRGNVNGFTSLYGGSAGPGQDDFFASVDQALFVANGGSVIGWAGGGQLIGRLMPLTEPKAVAEEMYLSILTRRPTDAEIAETTQQLTARAAERPAALRDLIWALVTSTEFRFNH